ncbi:STAS domain-containing protein [Phycicoccus avicenniae]|uniref:STAS domain-containing protein n=1 Tax=Phycicoccus avicenniae TaxID=2828860 RepID=UPI003D2967D8
MADQGDTVVTITEHQHAAGVLVVLNGRLDTRTVPDVRLTLHRLVADGSDAVLLDLGQVEIGDATGLGLVVELRRRARRAGRSLHVVAADDRTRRLLRRARLHGLLAAVAVPCAEAPSEQALAGA